MDRGLPNASLTWLSREWDAKALCAVNARTATFSDAKTPSTALYIFASDQGYIRPGAIGVNRRFVPDRDMYAATGNSVNGRFNQYAGVPKDDQASGDKKRKSKRELLPWSGNPWRYIWIAQFDDPQILGPALCVAEQILHFDIRAAGFRYLGSSCHECPKERLPEAIDVARAAMKKFELAAPVLFSCAA